MLRVLRPFDPWRSPLCTCPRQLTLNPYTGCGHKCAYCYITAYVRDAFSPRPKENLLSDLVKDLKKIGPGTLVSMSLSSDPYTPPEEELGLTRRALDLLIRAGARVLVVTKSDLVTRDADILAKGSTAVMVTVTTMDDSVARAIEPGAPLPRRRIRAMSLLAENGIPVGLRLDPIIPGVTDSEESLAEVLEAAKSAGASHVVASTYKARPDNLIRMMKALPEHAERLKSLYIRGERIGGYWYLPRSTRREILRRVRGLALQAGLTFATCREGMVDMNSGGVACDGSHLTLRGIKGPAGINGY